MTLPVLPSPLRSGLHGRPMRRDDAGRWADLLAAIEDADQRGEHYDAADCAEELADPELDVERETVLLLDGPAGADARAVAYQVLRSRSGRAEGPSLISDAGVHPAYRRRGIGNALLAAARERATELGATLRIRVPESNKGAVALAEAAGMVPLRWWSELDRTLTEPIAPAPAPAGLAVSSLGPDYDAARWDGPLRTAHNSAFADHWGSAPVSAEGWAHSRTGSRAFRPACSAVATTADGGIAGYLLSYEYDADTARTGRRDLYVATVGTVAAHRRRGVAAALLAHVLRTARDCGYDTSSLTVDAQNPTGALGVYDRAGYRLRRREITFALTSPRP
ncbi:GNAT family N-acetyltransferase [Pseudonocardia xinjiangensis]|uniref:GNAT family N-acetyltransferase n=1 Tax=Pseudonocardia xinjiangensis TaxID=75289 RepID=A0ABX1RTW5_9PSEU|nr:GNAT family N-acetyltransferase [Pseudonocardia xinjiangensis]NMH82703.1 GNAT family N-acetyltransferase [Pseudonocardia xinjiangensis]